MSSAQQRLSSIANHLSAESPARRKILEKNPDDVVRTDTFLSTD